MLLNESDRPGPSWVLTITEKTHSYTGLLLFPGITSQIKDNMHGLILGSDFVRIQTISTILKKEKAKNTDFIQKLNSISESMSGIREMSEPHSDISVPIRVTQI